MSNLGGKTVSEDTDKDNQGLDSVVAGTNIDNIDATDPRNPIINASGGAGEANTASNIGAGTGTVFKVKTGVDLVFKTLKQGTDITLSNDTDEVTINADNQLNNTTKGDLEVFTTVSTRLAVGADTFVLTADSGEASGIKWAAAPGGSPLTTKGDIFGFSTVDARLPVGTNDQVLTADSAETLGVKWATAAGGDPLTTKGDLFTFDTDAQRLAVGTDTQVLTADSGEATGMKWATPAAGSTSAASIRRDTDLAVASFVQFDFQTETYDDDGFADIGTDPERLTVPTGVTRVNVSTTMTTTATITDASGYALRINRINSSDVFQETVACANAAVGIVSLVASAAAVGVACVAGDYFIVNVNFDDSTVTVDKVVFAIQAVG